MQICYTLIQFNFDFSFLNFGVKVQTQFACTHTSCVTHKAVMQNGTHRSCSKENQACMDNILCYVGGGERKKKTGGGHVSRTYNWSAFVNNCCRGKALYYLFVCVCMWVTRSVGICMRIRACNLAYPACNAYAPYCDVICGPSISTTFFDIIS
jgi:hypothetical protein